MMNLHSFSDELMKVAVADVKSKKRARMLAGAGFGLPLAVGGALASKKGYEAAKEVFSRNPKFGKPNKAAIYLIPPVLLGGLGYIMGHGSTALGHALGKAVVPRLSKKRLKNADRYDKSPASKAMSGIGAGALGLYGGVGTFQTAMNVAKLSPNKSAALAALVGGASGASLYSSDKHTRNYLGSLRKDALDKFKKTKRAKK